LGGKNSWGGIWFLLILYITFAGSLAMVAGQGGCGWRVRRELERSGVFAFFGLKMKKVGIFSVSLQEELKESHHGRGF